MNDFDSYSIRIDSECLHQDFDDVDLYGTKTEPDNDDSFGTDLVLE